MWTPLDWTLGNLCSKNRMASLIKKIRNRNKQLPVFAFIYLLVNITYAVFGVACLVYAIVGISLTESDTVRLFATPMKTFWCTFGLISYAHAVCIPFSHDCHFCCRCFDLCIFNLCSRFSQQAAPLIVYDCSFKYLGDSHRHHRIDAVGIRNGYHLIRRRFMAVRSRLVRHWCHFGSRIHLHLLGNLIDRMPTET